MALGDYGKSVYVNGGPPGISADRLNNNENKTTELDLAQAAHLADYMPHDDEMNSYASNIDVNGIYTVVDFKRADATLYLKSTLSNTDASGNYQTVTWQFYDAAGTTIMLTKTWTLTYNIDNLIITKVVA